MCYKLIPYRGSAYYRFATFFDVFFLNEFVHFFVQLILIALIQESVCFEYCKVQWVLTKKEEQDKMHHPHYKSRHIENKLVHVNFSTNYINK